MNPIRRSGVALCLVVLISLGIASPQVKGQSSATTDRESKSNATAASAISDVADPDESAIRQSAVDFVAAFDRNDAEAIAKLWTADGIYIDESGQRFKGRKAIQKLYEEFFEDHRGSKLHISIGAVRKISPKVAIEDGVAVHTPASGDVATASKYVAVHVKQNDGSWLLEEVRDSALNAPSAKENLKYLNVLVGHWTAEHEGAEAEIASAWNPSHTFLMRDYKLTKDGKEISSSTEVVGWDPATAQITSWSFSSSGGRSVGVWTPLEDGWIVSHRGVTRDGQPTHSVDAWAPLLGEALGWKSIERYVDGKPVEGVRDVVLKKKPSSPEQKK